MIGWIGRLGAHWLGRGQLHLIRQRNQRRVKNPPSSITWITTDPLHGLTTERNHIFVRSVQRGIESSGIVTIANRLTEDSGLTPLLYCQELFPWRLDTSPFVLCQVINSAVQKWHLSYFIESVNCDHLFLLFICCI